MRLKKGQLPVFIIHTIALIIFTIIFLMRRNYEFMIYIGVIISLMTVILYTNEKVDYSISLLWGLTIWSIIHMSGAGIYINGIKLYDTMLIQIIGEPYNIFRYDHFAHIFGFAVATFLMYTILKPHLKEDGKWAALSIVIIMAGLGAGALNEIIEFFATVLIPETGVGGYENTALDLVSNAVGTVIAMTYILITEKFK